MKVKVYKCEEFHGFKKDGTPNDGVRCLVLYPDGRTAENIFIGSDVIDPAKVVRDGIYDMWRSEAGYVQIFNPIESEDRKE